MGLNFYTALFVSVTAVSSYLFLTKVVHIERVIVFLGEMLAVSLCWCPTTILYNYITYLFFNLAVMILYRGLTREKRILLFIAGVFLGANVLVRFPNLTEASLILAVWYYGILQSKRFKDVVQETGICMFGYLAGAGGILLQIASKYGWQAYREGILRLLQMPAEATDYSAYSMVLTVLLDYKFSSKWLIHLVLLTAAGCLASVPLSGICMGRFEKSEEKAGRGEKALCLLGCLLFFGGILALFRWWHAIGMFNIKYYTLESAFQWAAVFLILVIATGVFVLFSKKHTRNEKLFSLMILILMGVTPLGSNNHLYPILNNMFLIFPFGLWLFWRLLICLYEWGRVPLEESGFSISLFPLRAALTAFLAAMSLQCLLFGAVFTFRDGMSGQKRNTKIEKNVILKGMVTNAPLAEALEELTAYVEAEGLAHRELILYGQIPALSYMLDMPSALSTAWPDLRSYGQTVLEEDLNKLRGMKKEVRPLIILGADIERFVQGEEPTEIEVKYFMINEKWDMIYEFLIEQKYEKTYENDMFAVYR